MPTGGGGDNQTVAPLYNIETLVSIRVDTGELPSSVYTSLTMDALKEYIVVYGTFSDSEEEQILEASDYTFSIPSQSNQLVQGSNTITCTAGNQTTSFVIDGVLQDSIDKIEVETPTGNIYTSTTEETLKTMLTVYAYYISDPDTPVELSAEAYSVTWQRGASESATFTVSVLSQGTYYYDDFYHEILEVDVARIDGVRFNTEIMSSLSLDELLFETTFTGENNDGSTEIDPNDIEFRLIRGGPTLGTGADGSSTSKTLGVYRASDGELLKEVEITVQQDVLTSILLDRIERYYVAYETVQPGDLRVTAIFESGERRDLEYGEYQIIYPDGREHFLQGDTTYSVSYTENNITRTDQSASIRVDYALIDEPYSEGRDGNYNGSAYTWHINEYNDEILRYTSNSDKLTIELSDDGSTLTLSATEVATYTVTISIKDENYQWSTGRTGSIEYEFTIIGANPTLQLTIPSDIHYGDQYEMGLTVTGIGGQTIENPTIIWTFYGSSYDGLTTISSDEPSNTAPTEAGNWYVQAEFPEQGNYASTNTGYQNFEIQRQVVSLPNIDSKEYILNQNQTSGLSDTAQYDVVTDNGGIDVGRYPVTLELTSTNNYVWESGSTVSGNQATVYWGITPRILEKPDSDTTTFTYTGETLTYNPDLKGNGAYLSVTGNTGIDAGGYTAVVSLNDPVNTRWEDNTTEIVTFAWSIGRQGIPVPTAPNATFLGERQEASSILQNYNASRMRITPMTDGLRFESGNLYAVHGGTYSFTATITDDNYQWSTGDPDTQTLTWYIAPAENTVTVSLNGWTYDGGANVHTPVPSATFGTEFTITYTDEDATEPGTNTTQPVDAGRYKVWATLTGTDDYEGDTGFAVFEISKASNNVTVSLDGWVYGEAASTPVTDADFGMVIITYTSPNAEGPGTNTIRPENAGTYWIWAHVVETNNYDDAVNHDEFTIEKADNAITGLTLEGWTYGSDPNQPSVSTVLSGDAVDRYTYTSVEADGPGNDTTVPKNAGTYRVWAVVYEKSNYNPVSVYVEFEIQRLQVTPDLSFRQVQQDGNPHTPAVSTNSELLTSGLYTVDYDDDSSTNVGTYYLTVTLAGEGARNFYWVASNDPSDVFIPETGDAIRDVVQDGSDDTVITMWYRITVAQYSVDISLDQKEYTYTGDLPDIGLGTPTGNQNDIAITNWVSLPDEIKTTLGGNSGWYIRFFDSDNNEVTDGDDVAPGTYDVGLYIASTENYEQTDVVRIQITIGNAQIGYTEPINGSVEYDGTSHQVLTNGIEATLQGGKSATIEYSLDGGDWSATIPSVEDVKIVGDSVGSYRVYYRISAEYHDAVGSDNSLYFDYTVTQRDVTVTILDRTFTYTGSAPTIPTVVDGVNQYTVDDLVEGDDLDLSFSTTGVDPGQYDITGAWSNTNYDVTFTQKAGGACTIENATITVEITGYKGTYDGVAHPVATYEIGTQNDITANIEFSLQNDTTTATSDLTIKDATDRDVTVYYWVTAQYHDDASGTFSVNIGKKGLTITYNGDTVTYGDPFPSGYDDISFDGFVNNETSSVLGGSLDFSHNYVSEKSGRTPAEKQVTVTPFGYTSSNYNITYTGGTLTVERRPLTVVIPNVSVEYVDRLESVSQTVSISGTLAPGDVQSDLFTVIVEGYPDSMPDSVGLYRFVLQETELAQTNYDISCNGANYNITTSTVDIQIFSPTDFVYDGSPKVYRASPNEGDFVILVSYERHNGNEYEAIGSAPTNAGDYRVTFTVDDTNYVANTTSQTFTIAKATYNLNVTITNYVGTYDGNIHWPEYTGTIPTGADGKTPELVFTADDGSKGYRDVCTEAPVTITLTTTSPNYDVTGVKYEGTVTITPKSVDVHWSNEDTGFKNFVFDGTDQIDGVTAYYEDINGNHVDLNVSTTTNNGVFRDYADNGYRFTADMVTEDGNYSLTGDTATYVMQKREVHVTINNDAVEYGDPIDLSYVGYTYDADTPYRFVDGDTAVQGLRLTTNAVKGSFPGTYSITFESTNMLNYDLHPNNGTLTIGPRSLTVEILSQTHTYDRTDPDASSSTQYWRVTQGSIYQDQDPRIYLTREPGSDVGFYDITGGWDNTTFYKVTFINGEEKFEITEASITVEIGTDLIPYSGEYDGTAHSVVVGDPVAHTADSEHDTEVDFTYSLTENGDYTSILELTNRGPNADSTYTVYFKANKENHLEYSGQFTVTITRAGNSWTTEYSNSGWTYGGYVDTVTNAVAKFGTVNTYEYFTDPECNTSYTAGFDNGTPAGTYYVRVSVSEEYNYVGISDVYSFTVQRAPYSPEWAESQKQYSGSMLTNTLKINGSIADVTGYSPADEAATTVDRDGTKITVSMSAQNAGSYYATLTITDRNYVFIVDGLQSETCTVTWNIYASGNHWVITPGIDGWTYGGNVSAPYGSAYSGTIVFTYSNKADGVFTSSIPLNAGTWYMKATVAGTDEYAGLSETIEFVISPAKVPLPTADLDGDGDGYVYDYGNPVELITTYDQLHVSVNGNVTTTAGEKTAVFSLIDNDNYVWDLSEGDSRDPSGDIEIGWQVSKLTITKPGDTDSGGHNSYLYDGDLKTFIPKGFDDRTMAIAGNTGINVVEEGYTAIVSLRDANNLVWTDSTSGPVEIQWSITPIVVNAPSVTLLDNMEYTGNEIILAVTGLDTGYMRLTSDNASVHVNSETDVSVGAVNAGDYSATVTLRYPGNYVWSNDAGAVDGMVTLNWTIQKQQIDAPSGGTFPTYTGSSVTYIPDGYDQSIMMIAENVKTWVSPDGYQAIVTIRDDNYRWADGIVTNGSGGVILDWNVQKADYDMTGVEYTLSFVYDGAGHQPIVGNLPTGMDGIQVNVSEISGTPVVSGEDEFVIIFSTTSPNYNAPANVSVTVTVSDRSITLVANGGEFEYGNPLNLGWRYASGSESIVGDPSGITLSLHDSDGSLVTDLTPSVGTYTAVVDLPEGMDGNAISLQNGTVVIYERSIVVTIDPKSSQYGGSIENLTAEITNGTLAEGDTNVYSLSTNATSTSEPGSYNILGNVENDNYRITFVNQLDSYTITKIGVDRPTSGNNHLPYTGSTITYIPNGFDSTIMMIEGNTSSSIDTYEAIISLRDTAHYQWNGAGDETVTIAWSIYEENGLYPHLADTSIEYSGETVSVEILGFDDDAMDIVESVSYQSGRFYILVQDVGIYTLHITKTDDSRSWADGVTVDDQDRAVLTFEVTKQEVPVPVPSGSPMYTGESIPAPFASSTIYHIPENGGSSAVEAGPHYTTFRLNDTDHYKWVTTDDAEVTVEWQILPSTDVDEHDFEFDDSDATFTGTEIRREVTSNVLGENDYDVSYSSDLINTGTVTVTIAGKGNYSFTIVLEYQIVAKKVDLPQAPSFEYDGELKTAFESEYEWYTVSGELTSTNVGDYDAVFHLKYNTDGHTNVVWSDGGSDDRTVTWSIGSSSLPSEGWSFEDSDRVYDGTSDDRKPTHVTLVEGTDYTIQYPENQRNAGLKTFTVTGINGYSGTQTFMYEITVLTVHVPDVGDLPYRGEEQTAVSSGDWYTVSGTNAATDVGDYSATLTLHHNTDGHTNTAWDREFDGTIEWSITPVDATVTSPTASSVGRGDTLSDSTLSGGSVTGVNGETLGGHFEWQNPSATVNGSGSYTAVFVFDDDQDTANYNPVTVQVRVTATGGGTGPVNPPIDPNPPEDPDDPDDPDVPETEPVTDLEFPEAGEITEGQTLADSILTGGSTGGTFEWMEPTTAPSSGEHEFLMVFTPTDGRDYTQVEGWDDASGTVQRLVDITVLPAESPEPSPESPGFPWWIVLLIVIVLIVIIVIAWKRRSEEE